MTEQKTEKTFTQDEVNVDDPTTVRKSLGAVRDDLPELSRSIESRDHASTRKALFLPNDQEG